jgi:hypothetical protein
LEEIHEAAYKGLTDQDAKAPPIDTGDNLEGWLKWPNPQLLHALLPIGLRYDGSLQVHLKVDYAIRGRD